MELTKKKSFATYSCITINIDYFSKLKSNQMANKWTGDNKGSIFFTAIR